MLGALTLAYRTCDRGKHRLDRQWPKHPSDLQARGPTGISDFRWLHLYHTDRAVTACRATTALSLSRATTSLLSGRAMTTPATASSSQGAHRRGPYPHRRRLLSCQRPPDTRNRGTQTHRPSAQMLARASARRLPVEQGRLAMIYHRLRHLDNKRQLRVRQNTLSPGATVSRNPPRHCRAGTRALSACRPRSGPTTSHHITYHLLILRRPRRHCSAPETS